MRAYVDSNLLLQFKPLDHFDWPSLLKEASVELVIIPAVLREIEEKRNGENRRLRKRATSALNFLKKCVGEGLSGMVRDRVILTIHTDEPVEELSNYGLSKLINDDWLLATIIEDKSDSLLLSDDMTLLMKARARNIRTLRPPDDARLPPEEDEDLRKLTEENRQLQQRLNKQPRLRLTFSDGANVLRETVTAPLTLDEALLLGEADKKRAELLRDAEIIERKHRAAGGWLPIEKFKPEMVDSYVKGWIRYKHELNSHLNLIRRSAAIRLRLLNEGQAPASGIEVYVRIPDGIPAGSEPPREPSPPTLPSFFRSFPESPHLGPAPSFNSLLAAQYSPPRWRVQEDGRYLRISVEELIHTLHTEFEPFWMAFPEEDGKAKGFEFEYSILISRPPDETTGSLSMVPSFT